LKKFKRKQSLVDKKDPSQKKPGRIRKKATCPTRSQNKRDIVFSLSQKRGKGHLAILCISARGEN